MIEEITNAMREMIVRHTSSIQSTEKKPGSRLLEETIANTISKMLLDLTRKKCLRRHFNWLQGNGFRIIRL